MQQILTVLLKFRSKILIQEQIISASKAHKCLPKYCAVEGLKDQVSTRKCSRYIMACHDVPFLQQHHHHQTINVALMWKPEWLWQLNPIGKVPVLLHKVRKTTSKHTNKQLFKKYIQTNNYTNKQLYKRTMKHKFCNANMYASYYLLRSFFRSQQVS